MREIILDKLNEIERRENVRIIHCVESGSRAWGFNSPDSDYDVRFVYVRPEDFYLRLDKTRDVIEWQLDDTLDINGWDIRKALGLLHKSNPTVFEWNRSPIVYKTTDVWRRIAAVADSYFVAKSAMYHYLSIAKKNFKKYLGEDTVPFKKYFYMLRPVLACRWILERGTPPPIEFSALMESCLFEQDVKRDVVKLLDLKINSPEIAIGKPLERIDEFLDKEIAKNDSLLLEMPDGERKGWEELNDLFLSLVKTQKT